MGEAAVIIWTIAMFAITAISAIVGALVVLPPKGWRKLPWPEQARLLYPPFIAPVITCFVLLFIITWSSMVFFSFSPFRPPLRMLLLSVALALLGAVFVAMSLIWLLSPRRPGLIYWLAGCISCVLFGYPNTLVVTPMAVALVTFPLDLSIVIFILLLGALGIGFACWGGGILVARALGLARPALPRAANAADWAGERVGVRPRAVFELRWPKVAVDAFVFSRYIIVSDAAAELLSDDELFALIIRETTFFQQPWLAGGIRLMDSAVIYFLLACTAVGVMLGGHAMPIGIITGFCCAYIMRPFSKRAQLRADALAAQSAIDPVSALNALHRQYELNLKPVVAVSNRNRDAHLYDRMIAAGIPMPYPRPAPPSSARIFLSILAAIGTCVFLSIGSIFILAIFFSL